jgi:hypothetical protein
MNPDELAARVIEAIQGKPEAVTAISNALVSGDADQISGAISTHAGIQITPEEARQIAAQVQANPNSAAAYGT